MAITARATEEAGYRAIAVAFNADRVSRVAANFHVDATQVTTGDYTQPAAATITTLLPTNAVDITTSIALCNALRSIMVTHMADAVSTDRFGIGSHKTPDTTNSPNLGALVLTTGVLATDTASVVAAVNLHKSAYNAHLTQANAHYTNDGTNAVATANATDLPSSITLLNAIKTALTAHVAGALGGYGVRLSNP